MNLEVLTPGQKRIYLAVQDHLKRNPDDSASKALKKLKLTASTYSAAKKRLSFGKTRTYRKQKMITLLPEPTRSNHVVAFIGAPEDVVNSVQRFMGQNA